MTYFDSKIQKKLLQEVSESCWDVLIRWFFEYGSHDFYGNSFFAIMDMVLRIKDEKIAFTVLFKIGLLPKITKLIETFQKREIPKESQFLVYTIKRICLSLAAAVNVTLPYYYII